MASKNPSTDLSGEITALLGGSSSNSVGQVLTGSASSLGGTNVSLATGSGSGGAVTQQLTSITQQLQELQTINQTQIQSLEANTNAVSQNTSSKGQSGSSTAGSIGSTLLNVFGLGSGLSPLISGLVSLFGGGGSSEPTPVSPYIQPLPVNLTAGISSASQSGAFGVDYGQGGHPRPVSSSAAAQITVQVQAMDSQSFLDHSSDIANAVRKAMLESSTLNDVIREV